MKNGFKQIAPLSFQIRPLIIFRSLLSTYTGVLYTQKIIERWDPNYIDTSTNQRSLQLSTILYRGVFYGQAINPSISASFNPQIFGIIFLQILIQDFRQSVM